MIDIRYARPDLMGRLYGDLKHDFASQCRALIYNAVVFDVNVFNRNVFDVAFEEDAFPIRVQTWEEVGKIVDLTTLMVERSPWGCRYRWSSDLWNESHGGQVGL